MHKELSRRGGSLETGLDILEALAAGGSLRVTEIGRRVGADKANVHRLLQVLRVRGYVDQDEASKEYRPTAQLLAVAGEILRELDLLSVVRPLMAKLKETTGESVHVAVPTALGAVYVAQARSKSTVTVDTEIGSLAFIHCTASGKAIYAFLPVERLRALVHDPVQRYTMRTVESVTALEWDLARVRERGYALDDEECTVGVRCVAAPIFDFHGDVVASLGISGPAARVTLERVDAIAALVKEMAAEATRQLGGPKSGNEGPKPLSKAPPNAATSILTRRA